MVRKKGNPRVGGRLQSQPRQRRRRQAQGKVLKKDRGFLLGDA